MHRHGNEPSINLPTLPRLIHLREVPCPTCGVPPGVVCVTTRGKAVGARIHGTHPARQRIAEARANRLAGASASRR
jgi:hypothetical protein